MILTTLTSSTKSTLVSFSNKQQIQISFISTSKASTKHTVYSVLRRKRKTTPVPLGEQPLHSQNQEVLLLFFHGVIFLLRFLWDKFPKNEFISPIRYCNYMLFVNALDDFALLKTHLNSSLNHKYFDPFLPLWCFKSFTSFKVRLHTSSISSPGYSSHITSTLSSLLKGLEVSQTPYAVSLLMIA